MKLTFKFIPVLLAALAACFLAGCVNVAGGGAFTSFIVFLVAALTLGIAACSDDSTGSSGKPTNGWLEDAASSDVAPESDAAATDTTITDGAQPDVTATDADDSDVTGLDASAPDADASEVDASDAQEPDAEDGRWEPCCQNGEVQSCFCPATMACNYGMFAMCDDGSCTLNPADCDPEPGTWESCCKDGVVDSCFCEAGMVCNYGMYNDCGDGTCTFITETCEDDDDTPGM